MHIVNAPVINLLIYAISYNMTFIKTLDKSSTIFKNLNLTLGSGWSIK